MDPDSQQIETAASAYLKLNAQIKILKTLNKQTNKQRYSCTHAINSAVGIATGYGLDGSGIESR